MYSECIRCPKLGTSCDGPNFAAMQPQQLIAWCKERKKHMGLTNAKLAELSGMSQGTVDSLLANSHADFKFGTIGPMLQVLVGGQWLGDPCADPTGSGDAELIERVKELEAGIAWRDDKIQHYKGQLDSMQTLITNTNARYTKQTEELRAMLKDQSERHAQSQDFLRDQIKNRNTAVKILTFATVLGWGLIIAALVIDKLNPHLGFFWRDLASMFNTGKLFKFMG